MKPMPKLILKIFADLAMTITLLLLMGYKMVGQEAHEWLGIGMFVLLIAHHMLNQNWTKSLFKGHYTFCRTVQTALVFAALLAMAGAAISGVILSRHVLSFLPISGKHSFARNLHMLSAYWGFLFLSLHLGFHMGMLNGIGKKYLKNFPKAAGFFLKAIALFLVVYGVYAFYKRGICSYLFLNKQFAFFDFNETPACFLMDYLAILTLFACFGYFLSEWIKDSTNKKSA